MRKAFVLFAFFLWTSGCSKQFETNTEIPANIASFDESYAIEYVIDDIEKLFKQMHISVNIRAIPIIVTNNIAGDGRCQLSLETSAILIHPNVFNNDDNDPNLNQIPRLWSVILHEIGHCYFFRSHEEKNILAPEDHMFLFKSKIATPNGYECHYALRSSWKSTVMGQNSLSITPENLKRFYVQELVGMNPNPSLSDLLEEAPNIQVIHHSQAPHRTMPVSCD